MRRLRVLVLMHGHLVPPPNAASLPRARQWLFRMELEVMRTLRRLGHEPRALGADDDLAPIEQVLQAWQPHIVWNLLTYFHEVPTYDANLVAWLELRQQPYTGCNPRGLLLAGDKELSKRVLQAHGVPVPAFAIVPRRRTLARLPAGVTFPAIVKSATEHGSEGIGQASVVSDLDGMRRQVRRVHRTLGTDALVEQFLSGREFSIAVLGNERLRVLPPRELWFERLPRGQHAIQTERVKWDDAFARRLGARSSPARSMPGATRTALARIARASYRALGLSGFARIDLRLDQNGQPFVLEVNANPDLTPGEDVPESARRSGLGYAQLLQRVLDLGLAYRAAWR